MSKTFSWALAALTVWMVSYSNDVHAFGRKKPNPLPAPSPSTSPFPILPIIPVTPVCKTNLYPNFDTIIGRRAKITQDQGMQAIHCLPDAPMVHLCQSFLELGSMDAELLRSRLTTDAEFWSNVVTIDYNYALSQSAKNEKEQKYAIFLSMIIQRTQGVDQALRDARDVQTVFIGDSLMHFFEGIGTAEFPTGLFAGISGDRTDSLLYRVLHHVGKIRPKNVVISISGNDFLQGCENEKIQERRQLIANALHSSGVQNIYWLSLPPLGDPQKTLGIPGQNTAIQTITGIQYIDTWTEMAGPDLMIKPEYKGDGIHFNEKGYREVWIPKLKALGL